MVSLKKYVIEHFSKQKGYLKEDEQSKKEDSWILSALAASLDKSMQYKLLELGCGGGGLLLILSSTFPNMCLYGIDIARSLLVSATKTKANLLISDGEELPFKSDSFDIAICRNLLHHLIGKSRFVSQANVWSVLSEVRRVLKEEGYFIIIEQCVSSKALAHLIFMFTYILARLNISFHFLGIQDRVIVSFLTTSEILVRIQKLHMKIVEKWDVCGLGLYKPFVRTFIVARKMGINRCKSRVKLT